MENILARLKKGEYRLFHTATLILSITLFFTLLISEIIHYHTTKSLFIEEVEKERLTTLQLFRSHIEKDIKFGLKSEVYRKCSSFFENRQISSLKISIPNKGNICSFSSKENTQQEIRKMNIHYGGKDSNILATILIGFNSQYLNSIQDQNIKLTALLLIFALISIIFFSREIFKKIIYPIEEMASILSFGKIDKINDYVKNKRSFIKELDNFYNSIRNMSFQIKKSKEESLRQEKGKYLYDQANQIVHDIRNPILRLKLKIGNNIKDAKIKNNLTKEIQFIEDLTSNMLNEYKSKDIRRKDTKTTYTDIITAIKKSVTDAKIDFPQTKILFKNNSQYENIFVDTPQNSINRILDNIIKNSFEALNEGKGRISIHLSTKNKMSLIEIKDNGKGIPLNIIKDITKKNFSYQKESGSGIGLNYCKNEIEKYNGQIKIHSSLGKGTTTLIQFPTLKTPIWSSNKIYLQEKSKLIVLDDEKDIHLYWDYIYEKYKLKNIKIDLLHFYTISDFEYFLKGYNPGKEDRFIFDYDLKNKSNVKGTDLIEKYNLYNSSIIISNHFDDKSLIDKCQEKSFKLFPKKDIESLEIGCLLPHKNRSEKTLVILDDDDEILKGLTSFLSPSEFKIITYNSCLHLLKNLNIFNKNTVFLIDLNLDSLEDGLFLTKELAFAGFENLYLFTGQNIDKKNAYWIKGFIQKDAPDQIIDNFH